MDKLNPCPICGKLDLYADGTKQYWLWGFGIGCLNPCCTDRSLTLKFGLTEAQAKRRAVKAWNRRASDA